MDWADNLVFTENKIFMKKLRITTFRSVDYYKKGGKIKQKKHMKLGITKKSFSPTVFI